MKPKAVVVAIAALLVAGLFADGAQAQERRRAVVRLSGEGIDLALWSDSLEAALARSPRIGTVRRASGETPPAEEAGRIGFDFAVDATAAPYDADGARGIRVSWSIYAAASAEAFDSGILEGVEPEARDLPAFWLGLVQAAERAAPEIGGFGRAAIVIAGPEGSVVTGLGKDAIAIPSEGEIKLWLPAPATYRWRAILPESVPLTGVLTLAAPGARIELDFTPLSPWRVEAGFVNGTFLDVWGSWRFADGHYYLRAGFYQYLAGISLTKESFSEDSSLWSSYPLLQPGIGAGALFGGAEARLRGYAGATITTRLAFPAGGGLFIDPIAPLAVGPLYGLEWRPLDRWAFFLEAYANLYLFGDGALMAASRESGGGPFLYGSSWYLEIPLMRLGARFTL